MGQKSNRTDSNSTNNISSHHFITMPVKNKEDDHHDTDDELVENAKEIETECSKDFSSLPASNSSFHQLLQDNQTKKYKDYIYVADEDIVGNFKQVRQIFPEKLHALITQYEEDGKSHIVSWNHHGRAFKIHDEDVFINNISPFFSCVLYAIFFEKPR